MIPARILVIVAAAFGCLAMLPSSAAAFTVGMQSDGELINPDRTPEQQAAAIAKMRAAGVQVVRMNVSWAHIAANCGGRSATALRNSDNGCYSWTVLDGAIRLARQNNMEVIISPNKVPRWVLGSTNEANIGSTAAQFNKTVVNYGLFMSAIGRRYRSSSTVGDVKYWTIWNEPNSSTFWFPISPKTTPARYAQMYSNAARQLRAAHPTAQIAVGPTGPQSTIKPQIFIREVLRFLPSRLPGASISAKRRYLNAWAHNPYAGSLAGPRVRTYRLPNIGIGNMDDLYRELDRAPLTRGIKVWATEYAYQTNPPDRRFGVSLTNQATWLGEGLDVLESRKRTTIAIWYILTDPPSDNAGSDFQSGLYTLAGRAKPALAMYRRPISVSAARVQRGAVVRVWGRSNLNPRATRLLWSANGVTRWMPIPGQRRGADGVTVATFRATTKRFVTTNDGPGRNGPVRTVTVAGG